MNKKSIQRKETQIRTSFGVDVNEVFDNDVKGIILEAYSKLVLYHDILRMKFIVIKIFLVMLNL